MYEIKKNEKGIKVLEEIIILTPGEKRNIKKLGDLIVIHSTGPEEGELWEIDCRRRKNSYPIPYQPRRSPARLSGENFIIVSSLENENDFKIIINHYFLPNWVFY